MDAIERAINKGLHISGVENIDKQKWADFEQAITGKKLFLFGVGVCTDYFWLRYGESLSMEGFIDNSTQKQGKAVDFFQAEALEKSSEKIKISSVDILQNYAPDEVVILIGSSNYYKEIIGQLEQLGFYSYYVLLIMEANERKINDSKQYDDEMLRESFASYCTQYPICSNKIVFNDTYGGHQRPIMEQLLMFKNDLDIVWITKDLSAKVPDGVRVVYEGNWKRYIYELETAKVWIWDLYVAPYIIKRDEQYFIQTKHWASITLKKFALEDATALENRKSIEICLYNSKLMDYIIVGSSFDAESCTRGFDFHKDFIMAGSPRSDILFQEERNKQKVCQYFNIDKECHTVLYAPTFRYNLERKSETIAEVKGVDINFELLKEVLESKFGGEWKILLRLHPLVAKQSGKIVRPSYVLDASSYEDSQELVSASDLLITDYSSIMFEAAFVKKPVFLFATDRDEYIGKERDLLIDYDTLPFPIAESNQELVEAIENFDKQKYEKEVTEFLDSYGVHEDGHASERAAKFIIDLLEK